jgi:hypothetical protein
LSTSSSRPGPGLHPCFLRLRRFRNKIPLLPTTLLSAHGL